MSEIYSMPPEGHRPQLPGHINPNTSYEEGSAPGYLDIDPSTLISLDADNQIITGSDGKLLVEAPVAVIGGGSSGPITPSDLISSKSGNQISLGPDSKLYVPEPSIPPPSSPVATAFYPYGWTQNTPIDLGNGVWGYFKGGTITANADVFDATAFNISGISKICIIQYGGTFYDGTKYYPIGGSMGNAESYLEYDQSGNITLYTLSPFYRNARGYRLWLTYSKETI